MDHQDSINICIFEQSEELLFSDLSGPLKDQASKYVCMDVSEECEIKICLICLFKRSILTIKCILCFNK